MAAETQWFALQWQSFWSGPHRVSTPTRHAQRHRAWHRPTRGTRWTNEQLLFHMVFGYMIVLRLLILVKLFSRLPDRVGRVFAGLLDAAIKT